MQEKTCRKEQKSLLSSHLCNNRNSRLLSSAPIIPGLASNPPGEEHRINLKTSNYYANKYTNSQNAVFTSHYS